MTMSSPACAIHSRFAVLIRNSPRDEAESLLLARVGMDARNNGMRPHLERHLEDGAVRAGRRLQEGEPLSGDRMLDRVADLRHGASVVADRT